MIPRRTRTAAAAAFLVLAALSPATALAAPPQDKNGVEAASNGEEIALAVGETRTISARDVRNFSEGSPGIIEIKLTSDNSQFVISGKKPGSTTMLLIKSDGSQVSFAVHVFARSPAVVEKELGQLLDGIAGVRVRRVGSRS